jgi:putative endonuclease
MSTKQLGNWGEEQVCSFVQRQGMCVLDRNWRYSRYGELDIIARDENGVIVFVEVKTRRGEHNGAPVEAVDHHKFYQMRKIAAAYLQKSRQRAASIRFDVAGITVKRDGSYVYYVKGVNPSGYALDTIKEQL